MRTSNKAKACIIISEFISGLFTPIGMPSIGMFISLWITPLVWLSTSTKLISFGVIFGITTVIPLLTLITLKATGRISDMDVSKRKERLIPILTMMVCYSLATWYITQVHSPLWLTMFFFSGMVTTLIFGIITLLFRWKISGHGGGIGVVIGYIYALIYHNITIGLPMWLLIVSILIAGVVGSARVILRKHTIAQVITGILFGAVITFALIRP